MQNEEGGSRLTSEKEETICLCRFKAKKYLVGRADDGISGHSKRDVITPVERRFLWCELCSKSQFGGTIWRQNYRCTQGMGAIGVISNCCYYDHQQKSMEVVQTQQNLMK